MTPAMTERFFINCQDNSGGSVIVGIMDAMKRCSPFIVWLVWLKVQIRAVAAASASQSTISVNGSASFTPLVSSNFLLQIIQSR